MINTAKFGTNGWYRLHRNGQIQNKYSKYSNFGQLSKMVICARARAVCRIGVCARARARRLRALSGEYARVRIQIRMDRFRRCANNQFNKSNKSNQINQINQFTANQQIQIISIKSRRIMTDWISPDTGSRAGSPDRMRMDTDMIRIARARRSDTRRIRYRSVINKCNQQ